MADSFEQKLMQNPHIKDVTFAGNWLVSNGKMGWGREFDGHRVQLDVLPVATDFIAISPRPMTSTRTGHSS